MSSKYTYGALSRCSNVKSPDMTINACCSNEVRAILVPIVSEDFGWRRCAKVLMEAHCAGALRWGVKWDRKRYVV